MTKDNTWREVTLTLPPRMAYTHVFEDTKPNHYDINNLSVATLYAGVRVLPSPREYELMVPSNGRNILARKEGSSQIEIYNDSDVTARIILTSFNEPFNPAVLANSASGTSGGGGTGGTGGDGIIKGFTSSLPAGNNNIGKVVVTEMPAVSFMLQTLPPGTNHIGTVTVAKLPPLAEGKSFIGSVGVQGGVSITDMPPINVTNDPVRASCMAWEGSVNNSIVVFDMADKNVLKFNYIVNEGDTDLFVNFDTYIVNPTNLQGTNGLGATIRLKPGESITDFTRKTSKVNMTRISGTGTVRILGV
ncbi:hypothetical protein CN939_30255 [Bacillus thuringiensis]|uniref:hypothetical protein n=1 Tax=Bacillus thuringiensis TaxID=1428 RepID=UPI000BFC35B6|nr:hypothetical protein [Bacillus thuringiensis]PGL57369.1 hypothetical protein CN939_30255 [Bacillus thuringiensis]PGM34762.1 hypothetical protein CN937_29440 [Bacillus thuringiensis]